MPDQKTSANPLFLRDEDLRQGIELLFFAYRDFTSRGDVILAKHHFGRAHHRVVYFVGRFFPIEKKHEEIISVCFVKILYSACDM